MTIFIIVFFYKLLESLVVPEPHLVALSLLHRVKRFRIMYYSHVKHLKKKDGKTGLGNAGGRRGIDTKRNK